MSKQLIFVIAGNYREFKYHYPVNDRDIIYVHTVDQLRGYRGGKVVRVGTYYMRPDLEEIEREAQFVEMPQHPGGERE